MKCEACGGQGAKRGPTTVRTPGDRPYGVVEDLCNGCREAKQERIAAAVSRTGARFL